jgi:hypothetical protein
MRLHQDSLAGGAPALVVMCTRPRPAVGRTPPAAAAAWAQAAFELRQAMVACAFEDAEAWGGPVVLALAQATDLAWAAAIARREWSIVRQSSGNVGERINAVDELLRRNGARSLVFVGTNAPIHDESDYAAVRAALETADVALTPATDGGVTVMAARRPWPDLATLAWSTKRLAAELAYLCEREGLKVEKLGRRYRLETIDAEHIDDCARLVEDLAADARAKRKALVAIARRMLAARTA